MVLTGLSLAILIGWQYFFALTPPPPAVRASPVGAV